jgi:hypothetical protein
MSDRVARWRILLEIKGIHNTVADAISRLDYDPKLNTTNEYNHATHVMSTKVASNHQWTMFSKFWSCFNETQDPAALEQILNRIGETVTDRVDRFNIDVTESEARGVKFPFKPQITLPQRPRVSGTAASQIPTSTASVPTVSIDQERQNARAAIAAGAPADKVRERFKQKTNQEL